MPETPRRVVHTSSPSDNIRKQMPDTEGAYVSFAAAGVKIRQPSGFQEAERFDGFEEPARQASVLVVAIPGPYAEIARGFTKEQLQARGMTLRSKEDRSVEGLPGMLIHFTQNAGGKKWEKWAFVFGDPSRTIMVTASYPVEHKARLSSELKAAVLSTRLAPSAPSELVPDLGFTVTGSKKLKLSPGLGKAIVYTKEGVLPAKSPEEPLFIATPSLSKISIPDQREFARQRLYQTADTKIAKILSHEPVIIDGLEGFETVVEARHGKSKIPILLYQVMLFDGDAYILVQGLVGQQLSGEYLPEFKAMARSLKRQSIK